MPISVRKISRFLPVRFSMATSRTFSKVSQQASHGSVFTRAKDKSSLRGLKSVRFCFESCNESHETITGDNDIGISSVVSLLREWRLSPTVSTAL